MASAISSTAYDLLSQSPEYTKFRSTVPERKVTVDQDEEPWVMYEAGPKSVLCPLICLPPACGTADCFFYIVMKLAEKGYRVISLEYPVHWTVDEFCHNFEKLLDCLSLDQVHLFGASLGGFLAQKFAERCFLNQRVCSLFLCNSFTDTTVFEWTRPAKYMKFFPSFWLKRQIMTSLPTSKVEHRIADSIDFMVERLDRLDQAHIASRMTMNCTESNVDVTKLRNIMITVMDVNDQCVVTQKVKEDLYNSYPKAKRAHLKDGGNFPYLSRCEEVVLHLQIHLRNFFVTRHCPVDLSTVDPEELRLMRGGEPPREDEE